MAESGSAMLPDLAGVRWCLTARWCFDSVVSCLILILWRGPPAGRRRDSFGCFRLRYLRDFVIRAGKSPRSLPIGHGPNVLDGLDGQSMDALEQWC